MEFRIHPQEGTHYLQNVQQRWLQNYADTQACLRPLICKSVESGLDVIKLFSCSTQLSMKFKCLKNTEIAKIIGKFRFKSPKTAY